MTRNLFGVLLKSPQLEYSRNNEISNYGIQVKTARLIPNFHQKFSDHVETEDFYYFHQPIWRAAFSHVSTYSLGMLVSNASARYSVPGKNEGPTVSLGKPYLEMGKYAFEYVDNMHCRTIRNIQH